MIEAQTKLKNDFGNVNRFGRYFWSVFFSAIYFK